MDHERSFLNHIMMLLKEMVDVAYHDLIDMMNVAKEVLRQLIDLGVKITKQVIEKVITLLSNVRQGTEWACKKTKDAVYEIWESVKATTGFIGRLFKSIVVIGVNCVQYCLGRITGQELIDQTHRSVDNIMNPSSTPLVGAAAGAVTGAAIGTVVPGIGTVVGGLAGFIIGSFVGVTVARNT